MVMQACARSNTLYIRPHCATSQVCKSSKAADVCSTVGNEKESYNNLCQVKALVPVAHVSNSAAHACSLYNLAETCNGIVRPYLWSIGASTSLCDWHQCLDLTEIVVALFFISNGAAHICGLR